MELPSFREFLSELDMEKLIYDIDLNSPKGLKGPCPIPEDQQKYIADMIFTQTTALLGQYHQWLSEK